MTLPRDFHLSDPALELFLQNPVGDNSGKGSYIRRREGSRARIEATIEVERKLGNLYTREDLEHFIHHYALMLLKLHDVAGDQAEVTARQVEQQRRKA